MPNSALLDTCTLIRLGGYPETLSDEARATIENAWYLFVSPISLWEIVFKHKIGKLELAQPPKEWFATLKHEYELQTIPLTEEVMTHAAELPLHHRDPADRFIMRTRRELEKETSEEVWEQKNDALRRLGLRTIPNPKEQ